MGLFNYVDVSLPCPYCGKEVNTFQTKCGEAAMITVEPWSVNNFYTACNGCGKWIEYELGEVSDIINDAKEAVELIRQFVDLKKMPEYKINQLLDVARVFLERTRLGDNWFTCYRLKK